MKNWLLVALFNFFLAAILGALLRFAFVEEISWMNYRNVLHGHSHVAMLGWIYLALYALLIHYFLPKEKKEGIFYKRLFWVTQLSVIGMLVAFPIQGYAGFSIVFSSLHIFCSYIFAWRFFRDIKHLDRTRVSVHFVQASILFMVLSTFGIWALPISIAKGLAGSAFYYAAVQFFLHFQFNGWFIFAALGLFFFLLEKQEITFHKKHVAFFFNLLVISCFLTYALAVTWSTPLPWLFGLNSSGVVIQLAALLFFGLTIRGLGHFSKNDFLPVVRLLFGISVLCFIFKILVQTAVVIPDIATVAYTIRNFVLGFVHLLLLGLMSCFILGLAAHEKLISLKNNWAKYSLYIFLAGIFLTEILLFGQGTMLWTSLGFLPKYYELIFGISVLLPLGVGGIWISQFLKKS